MSDNGSRYEIPCPHCDSVLAEYVILNGACYILAGGLLLEYISSFDVARCAVCGRGVGVVSTPSNVPKFVARWVAKRDRMETPEQVT